MDSNTQTNTNTAISWISMAVAVIALILSVVAYNRAGVDLGEVVQRETEQALQEAESETEEAIQEAETEIDRAVYVTRLQAIRARVEAGEEAEEIADDVAALRADVEADLENADEAVRNEWQGFLQDMEELETDLRAGTADALSVLDRWITNLRQDTLEDEPSSLD